jgi:hypothetical protein
VSNATLDGNTGTAGVVNGTQVLSGGAGGAGANNTGVAAGGPSSGGAGGSAAGGGLYNDSLNTGTAGTLSVTGSTLAGNVVTAGFGGLGGPGTTQNGGQGGNGGPGGSAQGGGLFEGANTTLTVVNSTFGGTSADPAQPDVNRNILQAGTGGSGGNGGIAGGNLPGSNGGNGADGGNTQGGGVYVAGGSATFVDDTIAANRAFVTVQFGAGGTPGQRSGPGFANGTAGAAGAGSGGGYFAAGGSNAVGNTIIALNDAGNVSGTTTTHTGPNVFGAFDSQGNNVLGDPSGGTGFVATDKMNVPDTGPNGLNLGPLKNNGGPTPTDALLARSVAIDAGNNALVPPGVTTDQRGPGFPRIANGVVDVGAFEFQKPVITNPGDQTSNEGASVNLPIQSTGAQPGTFQIVGQPPGLTIDASNGTISGTIAPRAADVYTVTVSASGSDGSTGSTTFTWTVRDTTPPALTSPGDQTSTAGTAVNLPIASEDADPGSFSATGLPPGLTIDKNTGTISGTISPTGAGTYAVTVSALDGSVPASVSFTWTVMAPPPPAPTSYPPGLVPPGQVVFLQQGKVKRLRNGQFRMTLQVFNVGSLAVAAPVALLVGLPKRVRLVNRSGVSMVLAPGTSYKFAPTNAPLNPGEVFTVTLNFKAKSPKKIKPSFALVGGMSSF